MINKEVIGNIADHLFFLSEKVRNVSYVECREHTISFSNVNLNRQKAYLLQLREWEKENDDSRFIYFIIANPDVDLSSCHKSFAEAKESKRAERAYARLNTESIVFYVGSSKSLSNRIKDHLGFGYKGTYSIQMCYWVLEQKGGITIKIYRFGSEYSANAIQAIEDGLWNKYSPMFGRRGAR